MSLNKLSRYWRAISDAGIHDELRFSEKSRVRITNQMAFIVALVSVLYFLYEFGFSKSIRNEQEQISYNVLHLGAFLQYFLVHFLNRKRFYVAARFCSIIVYCGVLVFNSITLALPFHSELYFFGLAAFVFVIFKELILIIVIYVIIFLGYLVSSVVIIEQSETLTSIDFSLIFRELISFSLLFFILYFLRNENTRYQREIEIKNIQVSADRDEIQKINFTKDKIFSIISHDLRSPIGSLQALLGFIKQDQLSVQEFKKATGSLEKQVSQLKSSLDELLTWSKAQLHGINPVPEWIALKPLVYEVVAICRLTSRHKKIIITTNIPTDIHVYCDKNMLKSIITNLVTNAIKFTPVGGAISISCLAKVEHVEIVVEDTGIGITDENLAKVLSSSEHFTTRGTNNEKGTGLGLIMCKDFIEKNKGEFRIDSEDGKGSTFTILLPGRKPTVNTELSV